MTTIWAGPRNELVAALEESGQDPASVGFILYGCPGKVDRWCGIEPPPPEATVVIYQAPIEADGSATWREYRNPAGGRTFAPEVDVIFARF